MKSFKLKTLLLSSVVASATIVPCLTSCSAKTTIKVTGATIDMSKSHVEVDRDSTIYLIPNSGSKITGIKSITVGTTVLERMSYKFEYEQANGLAYKLTINAKSMTSVDVAIDVHTTDIQLTNASYNGFTQTFNATLNPYTLDVRAKYKDVEGETQLAVGEYLVFDEDDKDITSVVLSSDGYKMNVAKTYSFTIKSAIDTSKTTDLSITVTDPYKDVCEGVDFDTPDPLYCQVKMKDSAKSLTGHVEILRFVYAGGKVKEVKALCDNAFANSQAKQIEFVDGYSITTIQAGTFTGCNKLEAVNIPSKVTTIGTNTFVDCTKLETIYLDSQDIVNLTTDNSKLFANAKTIYIKNGLTDPGSTSYIVQQNFTKGTPGAQYTPWTKA